MKTYLFYDIETTGLNKCFDQVLQFACIRTDMQLQEIDRAEIKIKLNPDSIPSPYAITTHHIGIHDHCNELSEYEGIRKIHEWMNQPGTISLGYNTLGFDDEFLRFSFYRNLLTPYTHQYANDCSRMDLYPIAVLYFLYHNNCIEWPYIDGVPSLKLENINGVNNFFNGPAHDAMVDVEVTLALAKTFMKIPKLFEQAQASFQKQQDMMQMKKLSCEFQSRHGYHYHGLCIDGIYGGKNSYQAPVLFLGEHTIYKNQSLWLRLDTHLFLRQ